MLGATLGSALSIVAAGNVCVSMTSQQHAELTKHYSGLFITPRPIHSGDNINYFQNAFKSAPLFPRTKEQQEYRMGRMIEWKRHKLFERRVRHLGITLGFLIATPLVAALVSWCWRLSITAILE